MADHRDERYPVDPARRLEPERPSMGGPRTLATEPIKSEPDVSLDRRFDGRPPVGGRDVPPTGGEFGYGRRPEDEHAGAYRDYPQGYGDARDNTRVDPSRHPGEAERYGRGVEPVKTEPGRPETGRYDQGRYNQGRTVPETWQGQQQATTAANFKLGFRFKSPRPFWK